MRHSHESADGGPVARARRLLEEALAELDKCEGALEGKALLQATIDALTGTECASS